MQDHYYTIEREGTGEFTDRGSKFIAYAFPLEDPVVFKRRLQELKKEHHKAVHHCFAYRLGLTQDLFRMSDDGEPSGTAGRPILGQIDSKSLTNIAIIVVRYFGGTLLGVPGLINAYKTASGLVLQTIPCIKKTIEISYTIEFDYTRMNEVMQVIKQFHCRVSAQEMQLFCKITIHIPLRVLDQTVQKLTEMHFLQIEKK